MIHNSASCDVIIAVSLESFSFEIRGARTAISPDDEKRSARGDLSPFVTPFSSLNYHVIIIRKCQKLSCNNLIGSFGIKKFVTDHEINFKCMNITSRHLHELELTHIVVFITRLQFIFSPPFFIQLDQSNQLNEF